MLTTSSPANTFWDNLSSTIIQVSRIPATTTFTVAATNVAGTTTEDLISVTVSHLVLSANPAVLEIGSGATNPAQFYIDRTSTDATTVVSSTLHRLLGEQPQFRQQTLQLMQWKFGPDNLMLLLALQ